MRKTVGLLIEHLDPNDSYTSTLWADCYDLADADDCNLMLLPGKGPLNPDTAELAQTAAYRLLSSSLVHGAIMTQTVMTHMDSSHYDRFFSDLAKIPMVSTTVKLGSAPCCFIDGALGIRQVLRHLIEVHGCRRIAHLRGPKGNSEAAAREAIWHEEMELAGLAHGPDLLVQGHFDPNYIHNIGSALLERTGGNFDAVFACNDVCALQLIEDLRRLGKRVPEDYLVVGFDDIRRCQFSEPSLTTVWQPLADQARISWKNLTSLIDNPKAEIQDQTLGTKMIIRASCSCPHQSWSPEAFAQLAQTLELDSLAAENENPRFYQEASTQPSQELHAIMSHFDSAQTRVFNQVYELSHFLKALTNCQEIDELPKILSDWLPRLGFSYYALMQVCDHLGTPGEYKCELQPGELLPKPPDHFKYLTSRPAIDNPQKVIPAANLEISDWTNHLSRYVVGAYPLVVGENWYGLLFLELKRGVLITSRIIQEQVAALLERDRRTKAFIRERIEEQARTMIESEKMKALTILVTGIAHEINTPLGISITSSTFLSNNLENIQQKYHSESLSKGDLESCLSESKDGLELLQNNLQRATGLLRDFRKIAISEYTSEIQDFDLCDHIRMIVRSLKPALQAHSARMELLIPDRLVIRSWAFPFVEIINNLIMNALHHAFKEQIDRQITVSLAIDDNQKGIIIKVRDNGRGIKENDRIHIFEPFFTTRRSEGGTGLGLYIVFNLVTQKLNGSIHCNSRLNEGTVFKLTIPVEFAPLAASS